MDADYSYRWRPCTAGRRTAADILAKYSSEQIAEARRIVERRHARAIRAERKRRREAWVAAYFARCTAAGVAVDMTPPQEPWWQLRGWRETWRWRSNGPF